MFFFFSYEIYFKIYHSKIQMIQRQQIKAFVSQKTELISYDGTKNAKKMSEKSTNEQIKSYQAYFQNIQINDIFNKSKMFMKLANNNIFWFEGDLFNGINKIKVKSIEPFINYQIVKMKVSLNAFQTQLLILNMNQQSRNHSKNRIGQGAVGTIYQSNTHNHRMATKCFPIKNINNLQHQFLFVIRQFFFAKIMSSLQIGPMIFTDETFDIVRYTDCFQFKMEKCEESFAHQDIEENLKKSLMILHHLKIVHRDIKPANILYSRYFSKFVFCDFGLMQFVEQSLGQKTKTIPVGTYSYLPQETKNIFYLARIRQQTIETDLFYNDYWALKLSILQILSKPQVQQVQEVQFTLEQQGQEPIIELLFYLYQNQFDKVIKLKQHLSQYQEIVAIFLYSMQPNQKVRKFYVDIFRKVCCSYLYDQHCLDNIYSTSRIKYSKDSSDDRDTKKQNQFAQLYNSLQNLERSQKVYSQRGNQDFQIYLKQEIERQTPLNNIIVSFIIYVYNSFAQKLEDEAVFKICSIFTCAYFNIDIQEQLKYRINRYSDENIFGYIFDPNLHKRIIIQDIVIKQVIDHFFRNTYQKLDWSISVKKKIVSILFDFASLTSHPQSELILIELLKLPFDNYEKIDFALSIDRNSIPIEKLKIMVQTIIQGFANSDIKQMLLLISTELLKIKYLQNCSKLHKKDNQGIFELLKIFENYSFLKEKMVQSYAKILQLTINESQQVNFLLKLLSEFEQIAQKIKKIRSLCFYPEILIARKYSYLGDYNKAFFYIQKVQRLFGQAMTQNIGWFVLEKGNLAYKRQQYKKAQQYFDLELFITSNEKSVYLTSLLQINNIITQQQDYNGKYINLLQKAAIQLENESKVNQQIYRDVLTEIIMFKISSKKFVIYSDQVLSILQKYQKLVGRTQVYIELLAKYYVQMHECDKAKKVIIQGISVDSITGRKNMCMAAYLFYTSQNQQERKHGEELFITYHKQIPCEEKSNEFLAPFIALLLIIIFLSRNDSKNMFKYFKQHCTIINSLNSKQFTQSFIEIVSYYEKRTNKQFDSDMLKILLELNWFTMSYKFKPLVYFIFRLILLNKQQVSEMRPFLMLFHIAQILPNIQHSFLANMRSDYYKLFAYYLKQSKKYDRQKYRLKIINLSKLSMKYWKEQLVIPKIYTKPKIKTSCQDIKKRLTSKCDKLIKNVKISNKFKSDSK